MSSDRPDARRRQLLDAAVETFLRFGFKKTSMDDVARAAGVSRQALYLHFASKETLFEHGVRHVQQQAQAAATAALDDEAADIEDRLVSAFLALHALHFAHNTSLEHMGELVAAMSSSLAEELAAQQAQFITHVARVLRQQELVGAGEKPGAKDVARTLEAAAVGLKHTSTSLQAYREQMQVVVRVVCRTGGR
jgi:TetR/AcrR family transcriptional regulator of autoinduction and epiphytic fitness